MCRSTYILSAWAAVGFFPSVWGISVSGAFILLLLWLVTLTARPGFASPVLCCGWTLAEHRPTLPSFFVATLFFCPWSSLERCTSALVHVREGSTYCCPFPPTFTSDLGFLETFAGCVVDLLHLGNLPSLLAAVVVNLCELDTDFWWFVCWPFERWAVLSKCRFVLALFWPCDLVLAPFVEAAVLSSSRLFKTDFFIFERTVEPLEAVTVVLSLGSDLLTTDFVRTVSVIEVCLLFWVAWATAGMRPVLVLTSGPKLILESNVLVGQGKAEVYLLTTFLFDFFTTVWIVLDKVLSKGLFGVHKCFAYWHTGKMSMFSLLWTPRTFVTGHTADLAPRGGFFCSLPNLSDLLFSFPVACRKEKKKKKWKNVSR